MEGSAPSPAETWDEFFSDFYLRAYAGGNPEGDAPAQALAAAKLARCPDGGELLDVPCGFGRHSAPLAAAGFRVVGVDRSELLLAEARRRTPEHGTLELVNADYRALPFEDERFDAALNLFSSLGYLGDEEDTGVLTEIRRVLRPGARLVVETAHRDLIARDFHEHDWAAIGAGRLLLEQRLFDPLTGIAQSTQTLIESDGRRDSRTFSLRVYSATELAAMLTAAGFSEVRSYGDFDAGEFTSATRLVLVASR